MVPCSPSSRCRASSRRTMKHKRVSCYLGIGLGCIRAGMQIIEYATQPKRLMAGSVERTSRFKPMQRHVIESVKYIGTYVALAS